MKYIAILFLTFVPSWVIAQKLSESYVIARLKLTDSVPEHQKRHYLMKCCQLNSGNVDSVLTKKNIDDLLSIRAIYPLIHDHDSKNMVSYDYNSAIVHIDFKSEQTQKEKRNYWKMAKTRFVDRYINTDEVENSKDPLLMIDDRAIFKTQSKKRIEQLRLKDIYAITVNEKSFKTVALGENVKNGMIQIWTYATKQ